MSEDDEKWFVTERARALAIMHLTRRDELLIASGNPTSGLDYTVSIARKDERQSVRQFGVVLRAAREATAEEAVNRALRPTMQTLVRIKEFCYPVCLLYFTMEDNQGYYAWVAEPVLAEDGRPRLQLHSAAECHKLDREALDLLVSQVSAWYDAFFASVVISA